jgi:hypothetical protein
MISVMMAKKVYTKICIYVSVMFKYFPVIYYDK